MSDSPAPAPAPIPPARLQRALNLNILAGCLGVTWYVVCVPANILNVFVKNHLQATPFQLGLLTALMQMAAVFNLAAIVAYRRLPTRKPFWMATHILHRLLSFTLVAAALHVAHGGDRQRAIWMIIAATALSFILSHSSASGWWSWMADLVPETMRATFFGRRAAFCNAANMLSFFGATLLLDLCQNQLLYAYAGLFALMTILGTADILLFTAAPEPRPAKPAGSITWNEFTEPLRHPNFRTLCLAVGIFGLAVSVAAPFIAPFLTDPHQIGAPMTWLGIMGVLTQLTWIFTAPLWGMLMDRFGRKPAVLLGALHPFTWLLFLFLTPTNYTYLLPVQALAAGFVISGWGDGVNQLMLTLTPEKRRTSYVAWYMALAGVISAIGSLGGGLLFQQLGDFQVTVGPLHLVSFHIVILTALTLTAASLLLLARTQEGKTRPVSFLLSRLASPGIIRTVLDLNTLSSGTESDAIARTLRRLDGSSSELLVSDILARLDDPDLEVRIEAIRALGRLRAREAVEPLLERFCAPACPLRGEIARTLGKLGDPRAIPFLISTLDQAASDELQAACIHALGNLGGKRTTDHLLALLKKPLAEPLLVSGAEAVAKLGTLEAAWEILPRMHQTANLILRRQLAIAMANTLGRAGEFYACTSGTIPQQTAAQGRLFSEAADNLGRILRKAHTPRPALATLQAAMERAGQLLEEEDPAGALRELHTVYRGLATHLALPTPRQQQPADDEILLECALFHPSKLGLGFWTLLEIHHRLPTINDPELLRLDALLALYFLSHFETE